MKKVYISILMTIFSISFFTCSVFAENVPEKVLFASSSVVNIEVETSEIISSGSGFIVKNGSDGIYIATNHHVIEDNVKGVSIWTGKDEKRSATVVASSAQYDLAIIKIPEPIDGDALILFSDGEQGDEVFAVGFP